MVYPYDRLMMIADCSAVPKAPLKVNWSCAGDIPLSNGVLRYAISARYKSSLCSKDYGLDRTHWKPHNLRELLKFTTGETRPTIRHDNLRYSMSREERLHMSNHLST